MPTRTKPSTRRPPPRACADCGHPLAPPSARPFYSLLTGTRLLCLPCWAARDAAGEPHLDRIPPPHMLST